jgi:hypothetical protein
VVVVQVAWGVQQPLLPRVQVESVICFQLLEHITQEAVEEASVQLVLSVRAG